MNDRNEARALVPVDQTPASLVPRDFGEVKLVAAWAAESKFCAVRSVGEACMRILAGQAIGLPPAQALMEISIPEQLGNKPVVSAKAIKAMLLTAPACIRLVEVESTATRCVYETERKKTGVTRVVWTIERAQQAGLVKPNSNWVKYPTEMLRWRAVTEIARNVYPDVIGGLYALEEFDGETIDVTPGRAAETTPKVDQRKAAKAAREAKDVTPPKAEAKPATTTTETAEQAAELAHLKAKLGTLEKLYGPEKLSAWSKAWPPKSLGEAKRALAEIEAAADKPPPGLVLNRSTPEIDEAAAAVVREAREGIEAGEAERRDLQGSSEDEPGADG